MRLLLDTNILLDVILTGRAGNGTSTQMLDLCESGTHQGLVAWQTLPTVSYYHRKGHTTRETWDMLRDLLVFIEVVLDRTTPDVFEAFKRGVQAIPEVLECHMVAGGFDYLVKARVKDMNAYRDFLGKSLLQLNGVRETHTYAVMEEVKNTTNLPIK